MSLAEFVAERTGRSGRRKPGKPCSVCTLPPALLSEVSDALLAGTPSHALLVEYISDEGHDMTLARLQGHLRHGHLPGYQKRVR